MRSSGVRGPIVDRATYIDTQDEDLCAQFGQTLVRFLKSNAALTQRLFDQGVRRPDLRRRKVNTHRALRSTKGDPINAPRSLEFFLRCAETIVASDSAYYPIG